jgi:hypothetical protein
LWRTRRLEIQIEKERSFSTVRMIYGMETLLFVTATTSSAHSFFGGRDRL